MTSAPDALRNLRDCSRASLLIKRGLRLGALRGLFRDVPTNTMSRLYRDVLGEAAPPGRLPASFAGRTRSPLDLAAGAVLLADYRALSRDAGAGAQIEAGLLMTAWDRFCDLIGSVDPTDCELTVDITSFWLLLRDYRAGVVRLAPCAGCNRAYLRFDTDTGACHRCPECESA